MPLPPALTPDQRQAALDKAADARRRRAELKERLKMGSTTLPELLAVAGDDRERCVHVHVDVDTVMAERRHLAVESVAQEASDAA